MAEPFERSVSIEVDFKSAEDKLKKLNSVLKNGFDEGLKETLNETVAPKSGKDMKTFALKEMRKAYTVRTGRIQKNDKVQLKKATLSDLSAAVFTKGRPNALTYFKHKKHIPSQGRKPGTGKGAKAQVYKEGSLKGLPKAFAATMPNTHYGIFRRIAGTKHHPRKGRYSADKYKNVKSREKLKQLYGPGTSQMLWNEGVSSAIEKELGTRFDKAVDKAIDKVIDKAMKKASK